MGVDGNSGVLRIRIEDNPDIWLSTLSANTLLIHPAHGHVETPTTSTLTGCRWAPRVPGRQQHRDVQLLHRGQQHQRQLGATNEYWASPIRVTKGVACARGSVPTAAFPTF